jgi:hypothetical protein
MCHFSHWQRQYGTPVGSILADGGSVQGPAVNYLPSAMSALLFPMAEAVLQLALSWLAVAVFKLMAGNYQPSVMHSVLFTLGAIQADSNSVQATGSKLSTICNVCVDHTGRGRTPVGSILVGSGSVQAAS